MKLLKGVRILTVEQFGAGPYGTQLLADLGAEVIKIENPATGGDASRSVGPYKIGDSDSQYFQTFSRGKKSVSIDLKNDEDRQAFERLVRLLMSLPTICEVTSRPGSESPIPT